jgi:hypothetical protein
VPTSTTLPVEFKMVEPTSSKPANGCVVRLAPSEQVIDLLRSIRSLGACRGQPGEIRPLPTVERAGQVGAAEVLQVEVVVPTGKPDIADQPGDLDVLTQVRTRE